MPYIRVSISHISKQKYFFFTNFQVWSMFLADIKLSVYLFQTETEKKKKPQIPAALLKEALGKHDTNCGWHYHKALYRTALQTSPFQAQNSVNMQCMQQRGLNTSFAEEATTGHVNCRLQGMWSIFISECWLLLVLLWVPGTKVEYKGSRGKKRFFKNWTFCSRFFSTQNS